MKKTCLQNVIANILICVALNVVLGCVTTEKAVGEDYHVPFQMIGSSIPVIKVTLNEKNAWFIIDTGASATIINAALTKYFGITPHSKQQGELYGLGGTTSFESYLCRIRIGRVTINHPALKSKNLDAFFNHISFAENFEIAGILGSDILSRYKFIINYSNRTLSYKIHAMVGR